MHRRLVTVLFKNIPGAEDQVVELGQWHKVLDQRRSSVGAFPQTDCPHLCQTADGSGDSLTDRFDARNERGRHGAHSDEKNAELAFGISNRRAFLQHGSFSYRERLLVCIRAGRVPGGDRKFLRDLAESCRRIAQRTEDRGSKIEDRRSPHPFNPQSLVLGLRSSILDPRSSTLDPRSSILDPRSSIPASWRLDACKQKLNRYNSRSV